jgi:predicted HAD superfamily Cof-like phosphohydrolase
MLSELHAALNDERGRGNAALRLTLHEEEDVDRARLARELADVVYVAFGTAHAFAIDLDAALAEVHRAAMSKLDPATMVVREDGKILKPPGFIPPNMREAIL